MIDWGMFTKYAFVARVATETGIVAAHLGALLLTPSQSEVYGVNMRLHPTDRYVARFDEQATTVHLDVGYVIDESWFAVGHYYPGEAGLLLGELAVFPLPPTLRGPASVTFDDDGRSPFAALGAASAPRIHEDPAAWRWDRDVGALPHLPQEIYARLVRKIPFADMAIAAEASRISFKELGKVMHDARRDGLGKLTDGARWSEDADLYASLGAAESISDARKTYLQAAILFERFRDVNQVRYRIAQAMGMDVSSLAKKQSESKVRALLDGARRHHYLLAAGVSGRTSGGLTPLGRDLAAKHFPDLVEGVVS